VIGLKAAICNWFEFYNNKRPHSSFNGLTPEEDIIGVIVMISRKAAIAA